MHQILVSGIVIDVVRKDIKNLHLAVYPPDGRVRVAVPLLVNDDAVRLFTISRLAWIKHQRTRFQGQERQSVRDVVSRESHYYLGNRYLLNVIHRPGSSQILVRNKTTIDMYVPEESDVAQRHRLLLRWYRRQLKELVPPLIAKWQAIIGVEVREWGVKRMKTCWGTCTIEAGRIWLNLELVKKPVGCLEYILVHEMVHLLERHHNERFIAYMDRFMPQWRFHREELNRAPLGDERRDY